MLLMRFIIFTFSLFLFCQVNLEAQEKKVAIGQIDAAIIKLHFAAKSQDYKATMVSVNALDSVWSANKFKILDKYNCTAREEMNACRMDGTIATIQMYFEDRDYIPIKKGSEELSSIFKDIKQKEILESDPVDLLWNMYMHYEEVHRTVHDNMFGLREWFEFEDLVQVLARDIDLYNGIEFSAMQKYFPYLNRVENENQVEKLNNCFLYFKIINFGNSFFSFANS